jgi:hypothetical protein
MKHLGTLALVLAAAACSSSSSSGGNTGDGGTGGDASVDPAKACNDLASAYCAKIQSCVPYFVEITFGDVPTCVSRASASCTTAAGATGTSATAGTNEACGTALSAESCDDILDGKPPTACVIAPGTLASGAACGEDAQCASAFCGKPAGKYCGTCAAPPAAGAACVGGRCGPSLACGANAMCVTPGASGATCDANTPCLTTLSCGGGKCTTPVAAGATCDPKQMTTAGCQTTSGYFCNAATTKCEQVTIATANEACGIVHGGLTLCSGLGFCRGATSTAPGKCIAAAANGAACDDTMGPSCMAGAHCVNAICVADDPATCK